jgi:hypothetical protein
MFEALELQGVATGIEEEHRSLLSRLTGVAEARLQYEGNAGGTDTAGNILKVIPGKERPEVGHRHGNAVNTAGVLGRRGLARIVGGDLITEEVEIDPGVSTAAFPAAQHLAIESAGGVQVTYEEGEVKGLRHRRKHGTTRHAPQLEKDS